MGVKNRKKRYLINTTANNKNFSISRTCLHYIEATEDLARPAKKSNYYKEICRKYLQNSDFMKPFKLPLCDKSVNGVAQCININKNSLGESYAYSTKDLKFGDVIATTKSFETYSKEFICYNCATMKVEALLPCDNCSLVVFCSEECKEKAMNGFHQMECELAYLYRSIFDANALLALKTTFKIMDKQLDVTDEMHVGLKSQINCMLTVDQKELSFTDAFVFSISSTVAWKVLRRTSKFKHWLDKIPNGEVEFINLFAQIYKAVINNGFFDKVRHIDWIYGSMNGSKTQKEVNVLVYRHEYSNDNYYIACKNIKNGDHLVVGDR